MQFLVCLAGTVSWEIERQDRLKKFDENIRSKDSSPKHNDSNCSSLNGINRAQVGATSHICDE